MSDRLEPFLLRRDDLVGFKHLTEAVDHTPYDKCKVCAMPEAGQEENNQLVNGGTCISLTVSAERDINIFLEPG